MNAVNALLLAGVMIAMAYLIETAVEFLFGWLFDKFPTIKPWSAALRYVAVACGVAGAFIYQFDLISLLGEFFGVLIKVTWFGVTLTGIAIGMGSSYLHDFIGKYFVKKTS